MVDDSENSISDSNRSFSAAAKRTKANFIDYQGRICAWVDGTGWIRANTGQGKQLASCLAPLIDWVIKVEAKPQLYEDVFETVFNRLNREAFEHSGITGGWMPGELFGTAARPGREDFLLAVKNLIQKRLEQNVFPVEAHRNPAPSSVQTALAEPFREGANERPLGDNPFPIDHPAHGAFEEATWRAKAAVNAFKSDLLQIVSTPPFDFIQAILTYRVHAFSACANAALLVIGNEQTAAWYEDWINRLAKLMLDETLRRGQLQYNEAAPGDQALFTPELLPRITADLQVQLMRVVAQCKAEAAKRVLLVMDKRAKLTTSPDPNDPVGGDLVHRNSYVDLLDQILESRPTTIEKWAEEHKFGRTTVFDWRALRLAGKPLTGKVSPVKSAEIEEAIDSEARTLGLEARTSSD